uniref:MOR2-PAG1_N domain-containing protein n=1 Tax=Schistocephalus solidus TaxID=70667 RepID=A0A183TS94_SCHSO
LLKTCINCIPRLLPYEMSRTELVELLARVSLNVDEEVRMMAQQAMVNLIIESPPYRQKTIQAFIQFIQKYVPDTSPHQLDCGLKTLYTLLVNWKIALQRVSMIKYYYSPLSCWLYFCCIRIRERLQTIQSSCGLWFSFLLSGLFAHLYSKADRLYMNI